jgi:mono/diheme cytochrome c family protein
MKISILAFVLVALAAFAGITLAQPEVREAPLTWQQAALTDGEAPYMELCAVCHGTGGKGDGPAAGAMANPVTDLTALAARNGGVFPRDEVQASITGESRVAAHGTADMPVWGARFEEVRPDWKQHRREALARQRIYNLTLYLETLQAK